MVPLKRRRVVSSDPGITGTQDTKFPQVVLFLLERKMGASRRSFLSGLGRDKGFQVAEVFSESVTHVISENNSSNDVRAWLHSQRRRPVPVHLLDVSWYTESMRAGHPVHILDRHKLQQQPTNNAELLAFSVASYACQRRTTLDDHNAVLTGALSLLAENAELNEEEGRGVAFRRAAAVLKALPEPAMAVRQLSGLPCLGEHSLRVIRDILENGTSSEVESTKQSERFKAMKVFTGIFGVGAKTADRWFRGGICTLQQLRDSGQALNRAQRAGLVHYDDLNRPVTKAEADAICEIVGEATRAVLPGSLITLTGGFRRGKQTGHDVDFLITHPDEGREEGLMSKVVDWLEMRGFLLYQKTTRNSYLEAKDGPGRPASNMDRFERCFSIFKLVEQEKGGTKKQKLAENDACGDHMQVKGEESCQHLSGNHSNHDEEEVLEQTQHAGRRPWRAVRVDLVISPISQFAFALLGWTGSKLFERELRRFAGHEKAMSLSSHALYDNKQSKYLRASTEEEIFAHLSLDYIPPSERNA